MSGSILKFFWIIGIEGSGHHMVREVLGKLLSRSEVIDKGPHYPIFLQRWDSEQVPLPRQAVRNTLEMIFRAYISEGVTTIYEDTSFPFGGVGAAYQEFSSVGTFRGPLRSPDILDLLAILDDRIDLRILVLYRSPVLTVASALRRGFSAKPQFECRLAEAVHLQITYQLACLPTSCYRTLRFEDFVQNPEHYTDALATWFDISAEDVRSGIPAIRKSGTVQDIPDGTRRVIEEFFTTRRLEQLLQPYRSNQLLKS
jgi:hypothetical protein